MLVQRVVNLVIVLRLSVNNMKEQLQDKIDYATKELESIEPETLSEIPIREIEDEHDDPEWDSQF